MKKMEFELFEKLCALRGYEILDTEQLIVFNKRDNVRIRFFLCKNDKLDMAYFYRSYESLKDEIKHLIFIYSIATIQIKKLKTYKDVLKVEFFNIFELNRLLIGNRFIPKHQQVSAKERDVIIRKFGKDNLPLISTLDPIVKLHDFELDSVIEIERESVIYYRLVVQDD